MKEALFYKKLGNKAVQCELCPNFCALKPGELGKCSARKNIEGKLISLSYGKIAAMNIDPIEKKPFYHFLPGSKAFSIGTAGCNLHCRWCQNWTISQASPDTVPAQHVEPAQIVDEAKSHGCAAIAYTYTEPVVFYEYVLETAKLASKAKLKNVLVTNGFVNQEPLKKLLKHIDAANIDLKAMSDTVYRKYCGARLDPVLEAIETMLAKEIWVELTTLLIPSVNDGKAQIKKLIDWIKSNCGDAVPLHFSAYYPTYKFASPPTPISTVKQARKLALQAGLKYVYTGNISDTSGSNTYCPKCGKTVIERRYFSVTRVDVENGKCKLCGAKIAGIWD